MAKKAKAKVNTKEPFWLRNYHWILVVGGALGVYASITLALDELKLLQNPGFQPICNLNPLLSCTSVISSHQAKAFGGVPNPYWGIAGFAAVLTIGMGVVAAANYKKWFWQGLLAGTFLATLFIHWLFFQTVYNIGKLCIYCMLTWIVTIGIFWYTLLMNYQRGYLPFLSKKIKPVADFASRHHIDILIGWYIIIALLILNHFWYYFGPH